MARIRTIKPEFWTDEKVVQLPFEGRLLFIGLWNFADDYGYLDYSPDRIRMQVFPCDSAIEINDLIDLLAAAGLVEYWTSESDERLIKIANWEKHQKIDKPSQKTVADGKYKKRPIPQQARIAIAKKYSCPPGGMIDATCYYCGQTGSMRWWPLYGGKPSAWVSFNGLEIDHFVPEHGGGDNSADNMVLACRFCNRSKGHSDPLAFMEKRHPTIALASPREPSPLERKGRERKGSGKGEEENGKETKDEFANANSCPDESGPRAVEIRQVFDRYREHHPKAFAKPKSTSKEWRLILARLQEGFSAQDLMDAIDGNHRSPFHCGQNEDGRAHHALELIVRNGSKVTQFLEVLKSTGPPLSLKTQRTLAAGDAWERQSQEEA